jgi:SAM-dependent methyltransferase
MQVREDLKRRLTKLKGSALANFNRIRSVESIFQSIYLNKRWGDAETSSGTGSKLEQTVAIRKFLPYVFAKYDIRSVLDIPCGDFNWLSHVDLSGLTYYGADIVADLVKQNNESYKIPGRTFFHADIIRDALPEADLILCRDCLVHFSNRHILETLRNIKSTRCSFLFTTTFPEHENADTITGSWRPINLEAPPFSFPPPVEIIQEGFHKSQTGVSDKSMALWRIKDLL